MQHLTPLPTLVFVTIMGISTTLSHPNQPVSLFLPTSQGAVQGLSCARTCHDLDRLSPEGAITITDMDTTEKSNLN